MARYVGDQNRCGFFFESGLYASSSGTQQWIGRVQSHEIDEATGVIPIRYVSLGNRNVGQFVNGPLDFTGAITYFPQDWKFLMFALGSNVDAGSPSPYTHTISETNSASGNAFTSGTKNPFISFSLEDFQKGAATGQNFVRTVNGAIVDTFSFEWAQGDVISAEVNYIAQNISFSSGAATALTETTTRPFIWKDVQVHIPSGTVIDEIKEGAFSVNNNLDAPHYSAGSRVINVPLPLNRDYEVTLTVDATSERTKTFYDNYFLGGSTFNMMLQVTDSEAGAGSRDLFLVLSGCKLMDMEAPTAGEGVNEQSLTIQPQSASAVVNDLNELYNPW